MDLNPVKDFFISYNKADRAWAEWMASKLEDEGYTCIIQAWDFLAGGNFVLDMHRAAIEAQRTIAVLSPDYLTALYTQPEWAAAFVQDPTGKNGTLLPVRVRECKPQGILAPIVYIDLVTLDESNEASERATAEAIVAELDGFPLALDQAGAYIEETGCRLSDYLKFYQTRRKELMKRRGRLVKDHPETVATTWDLSFKQIEQENSAAVALLQLCAFLAPDAIQEEMITEGAEYLEKELAPIANDEYRLNETIEVLRRYSLVRRNKDMKMLSMHRLVQVTIRDSMSSETQQQWAKQAVYVVSSEFPFGDYQNWERCRRYLAQAQNCIDLIKQYEIETVKAGDLAYNAAYYLYQQQKYQQAEEYYQQALHIYMKILDTNHHRIGTIFHQLGRLSYSQGNYKNAKELAVKALHIYEKAPGSNNHRIAATFHQLALLSHSQKNYQEAENLYLQALSIYEKELGLNHSYTAFTLHQLGSLYYDQGDYKRAEEFGLQALHIEQKMLGSDHPDTASTLHSLAVLYHNQKQYEKAETFYRQALGVREKVLGLDHPRTINTVKSYTSLLRQTNRNAEAEALLARIKPKPDRPSS